MPTFVFLLLLATLTPAVALAQHVVTGSVTDADTADPLAGVHVYAPGTTLGTITGADGRFVLRSDRALGELTASFIGYRVQTIRVDGAAEVAFRLETTPLDLQPVVVSASRRTQSRKEAPVAIATLDVARLEETRPTMLYQALNQVPGVHMTNLGSEQHTMSIRQPIQYKALFVYLEDGLPIRPIGVFNHNALIEINMAAVERVEVLRGPSSALYGSNAVGGAVNFLTPEPTASLTGRLNARTGNYGYRRADFAISNTVGKLGFWAGGYLARQRDGWAEHSDFDKLSLSFRADYPLSEKTRLRATASINHLDADTRGNLDSTNFFGKGYSSLHTFTFRNVDATRATLMLEHDWSMTNATEFVVGYRDNAVGQLPHYRIRNNFSNRLAATGEINEDSFSSLIANLQHRLFIERLRASVTAGVTADVSPNSYFARYLAIERDETGRYVSFADSDSVLTDYNVDLANTAAFAQVDVEPVDRLRIVAALRYDRIEYDYDNHLPVSAFSGAPDQANGFDALSPKLGFTVDLGRGWGVYANTSAGFIPPEVGELYRGVKVPTLKPATFTSREVGGWAVLARGRVYADVSLYRMEGRDEIISVLVDDGSTENRNAGRTRHEGIEYALTFHPVRDLAFRIGGTNARHTFVRHQDGRVVLDGKDMDGAPGWVANAEVTWKPSAIRGSRFGLEWQHLGSYYLDAANTGRYGGYDLIFLRMGYEVRGVQLWANIENLTDRLFANVAARSRFGDSYNPGAARNVVFGVGYSF